MINREGLSVCIAKDGKAGKKKGDRKRTTSGLDTAREKTNQKRRKSIITRRRERNVQNRRGIAAEDASSTKRNTGDTGKIKG